MLASDSVENPVCMKTSSCSDAGLAPSSVTAQVLRQQEEAGDLRWAAAQREGAKQLEAAIQGDTDGAAYNEAVKQPRAPVVEAVAVGDSTWRTLDDKTTRISLDEHRSVAVQVRCASGGSLLKKGTQPTAPALTKLRHLLEFEPDSRPMKVVSFPMTGGHKTDHAYAANLPLPPGVALGQEFSLSALTMIWESSGQQERAWADKYHPTAAFCKYMLQIGLMQAEASGAQLRASDAALSSQDTLVVIVADGWNHEAMKWTEYANFRLELSRMRTVGEFKANYKRW